MDTFNYTVRDAGANGTPGDADDATSTATATVNVSGMIWFVQAGAAAGGGGRLSAPLNCLSGAGCLSAAATDANDNIFLYNGSYTGGVALKSGQKLLGENVAGSLATEAGITLAPFSDALPATNTGFYPTIANAAGNGVTLNSDNTVSGLRIGGSAFGIDDNGSVGALTVSRTLILSTGGGFRADNGGTLNVSLLGMTTNGGANGINIAGMSGGSFAIAGGVSISNSTGDAITLTNNASTFKSGVQTNITGTANGFIGIHLVGGTGAITFGTIVIDGRRDKGIRISGGSRNITTDAVDIDNTSADATIGLEILSPTGGNIQFGATTINNGNAASSAVEIQNSAAAVSFGAGSSIINSASHEFFVNGGAGNITYNGAITSTAGQMIAVNGRTGGTVEFLGNLTHTGANVGVSANSNTGGTVIFSGNISASGSTGQGISLTTNTGASFIFRGGLNLSTGTNAAFTATGGGTVSVCDENPCNGAATGALVNTITTTTGTALNVANTNVGANNLEFRSISSNGATNGIILNNTGSSGGLIVKGSGGTCTNADTSGCSGGTIQGATGGDDSSATPLGTGIVLNNTRNASFTRMWLKNHSNYAIRGNNSVGFTLADSLINGTNGSNSSTPFNDASVRFSELTGTVSVSGTEISGGFGDNFLIDNTTGVLNSTFSSVKIGANSTVGGNDGIQVEGTGTADVNVTVQNSIFTASRGDLFQWIADGTGGGALVFTGNTLSNSMGANIATGAGGVSLFAGAAGDATMNISGNTFRDSLTHAVLIVKSAPAGNGPCPAVPGSLNLVFDNNDIGVAGTANSGSLEGDGLKIQQAGCGTLTAAITNNEIRQYNNYGINMQGGAGVAYSGTMNFTVTGNTVANPGTNASIGNIFQGIHLNNGITGSAGTGDNYQTCYDVKSNSAVGSGRNGGTDLRTRSRMAGTVRLPGYSGSGNSTSAVSTYLANRNDANPNSTGAEAPVPSSSALADTATSFTGGAACTQPSTLTALPSTQPAQEEEAVNANGNPHNDLSFTNLFSQTPTETLAIIESFAEVSAKKSEFGSLNTKAETGKVSQINAGVEAKAVAEREIVQVKEIADRSSVSSFLSNTSAAVWELTGKIASSMIPTAQAQETNSLRAQTSQIGSKNDKQIQSTAMAGETVCVDADANNATCAGAGFTLPQNKTVTITFRAVVANTQGLAQVSNQGTVSGSNFAGILTNDPDTPAANDATVTLLDRTSVTAASNANPAVFGQNVTLTATLSGVPARVAGNPSGTVQFKENGNNIGSPVAVVAGAVNTATAQIVVNNLSVGNHTITAEYSGGNGYSANVGSLTNNPQVINKANTTVGVSSSQNPSITGQSVTFTATVGVSAPGAGAPTGTVSFLVGGNPEASCTSVALSGNTAQCTLTNLPAGAHNIDAQYSGDGNFNNSSGLLTGGQIVSNTAVWDGSTSTDWNDNSNWTTNLKPAAANGVSIPSAGVTNNPAISSNVSVNNLNEQSGRVLNIAAGATLTVTNVCTINGTMNVAGSFACGGLSSTGTINFTGAAAQNIPALTYNNFGVNNAAGVTLDGNVTVNGVLTLTNGVVKTNGNTLTMGTAGTVSRTSGHIAGNLQKNFGSTAAFTFHVGDADGEYAPVAATPTAAPAGATLTVSTTDSTLGGMDAARAISRFWSLAGSNLTTNLAFTYLAGDVSGNEANYKVWKKTGLAAPVSQCASACVNTATHTVSVSGVNSFSDWTAGESLAPTAAQVEVGGRVVTANGRAIRSARVVMIDSAGNQFEARTNPFGFFRFTNVAVGADYIFTVSHKSYVFANASQTHSINDAKSDINFVATEPTGGNPQ